MFHPFQTFPNKWTIRLSYLLEASSHQSGLFVGKRWTYISFAFWNRQDLSRSLGSHQRFILLSLVAVANCLWFFVTSEEGLSPWANYRKYSSCMVHTLHITNLSHLLRLSTQGRSAGTFWMAWGDQLLPRFHSLHTSPKASSQEHVSPSGSGTLDVMWNLWQGGRELVENLILKQDLCRSAFAPMLFWMHHLTPQCYKNCAMHLKKSGTLDLSSSLPMVAVWQGASNGGV